MFRVEKWCWQIDWDQFVDRSPMGTIFHKIGFLSYHGNKFSDASMVVFDGSRPVAVFPAAVAGGSVCSHPGSTVGGVVFHRRLSPEDLGEVVDALVCNYRDAGYESVLIRGTPGAMCRERVMTDFFTLGKHGFNVSRLDLWSVITGDSKMSSAKKRGVKNARKSGLEFTEIGVDEFYRLLSDVLRHRHGIEPHHTPEEIAMLVRMFPGDFNLVGVMSDGVLVAASMVVFLNDVAAHAHYIASSADGNRLHACDLLIHECCNMVFGSGRKVLTLGSVTYYGDFASDGLFRFKTGFGAGIDMHPFYEVGLI